MSPRSRRAVLIAVGDELLAGAHPDLNSPELARRLSELGIEVCRVSVVGDDEAHIAAAIVAAREVEISSSVTVTLKFFSPKDVWVMT